MSAKFLLLICGLISCVDQNLAEICAANEGGDFNLSHTLTQEVNDIITWNILDGDMYLPLGTCENNVQPDGSLPPCTVSDNNKYKMKRDRTTNTYTLTILRVASGDENTYYFRVAATKIHSCILKVYAKPETPTCQSPTIVSGMSGAQLTVTCSTEKVFPQAECMFKIQGSQISPLNVNYTHVESPSGGPEYYKSTCMLTYDVHSPSLYTFDVDMFVRISNTTYGQQSLTSGPINLTLPQAKLSSSCPSGNDVRGGYIKQGTTATCRCDRDDAGHPAGHVQWYNSGGAEITAVDSSNEFATISVSSKDADQSFSCKGKSILAVQDVGVSFIPKFAYGPNQVTISPADSTSTTIDLCPNHDVTIECSVSEDNVSPLPNFTVLFNDTDVQGSNQGSDLYSYTVTKTVSRAGTLNVTCRAVNSLFPDDFSKDSYSRIFAQKPPSSLPEIVINNNQPVVENVPFFLGCRVDGGFPLATDVNVTCQSQHGVTDVISETNVANQSVTVSRDMDGAQCHCVAQHVVTRCYSNNKATVNLNVTYQAAIKTFTANESASLIVDLHDYVNLTCVTDGNPTPTIIIQKSRDIDQKTDVGHKLTYVKDNVACNDTATYVCKVDNSVTTGKTSERIVQLYVKCPQQPQHEDNTTFSAIVGDSVTLDLDVMGYPAPIHYALERKEKVVATVNTTDGNGESESGSYQFKYLSDDPPFGTVQLTIGKLGKEHFTNYLLKIDNGVGQALEYSFVLETAPPSQTDNDVVAIAVGVTFGILVLVAVVIVVIVLRRKEMLKKCGDSSKRSGDAKNSTDIGQHNGAPVHYSNHPAGHNGEGTVYMGQADRYLYQNTVETAPTDFQSTSPTSPNYENVVPPIEPTSADSHSPYEN